MGGWLDCSMDQKTCARISMGIQNSGLKSTKSDLPQWSVHTRVFYGFQVYTCIFPYVYPFVHATATHSKHYQRIVIACSDTMTFTFSMPHINCKLMHSLLVIFLFQYVKTYPRQVDLRFTFTYLICVTWIDNTHD